MEKRPLVICTDPGIDDFIALSMVLSRPEFDVLGMVAIFTYGFPTAEQNFANAGVKLDTLSNYNTMIEMAIEQGYVHPDELETLKEWRRDPASWKK